MPQTDAPVSRQVRRALDRRAAKDAASARRKQPKRRIKATTERAPLSPLAVRWNMTVSKLARVIELGHTHVTLLHATKGHRRVHNRRLGLPWHDAAQQLAA